jgi:hypothetical protein
VRAALCRRSAFFKSESPPIDILFSREAQPSAVEFDAAVRVGGRTAQNGALQNENAAVFPPFLLRNGGFFRNGKTAASGVWLERLEKAGGRNATGLNFVYLMAVVFSLSCYRQRANDSLFRQAD